MNCILQQPIRKKECLSNKKKLLVYDTSRGLASIIKKKISSEYDIYFCLKDGDLEKVELNNFFAAIIIVNDIDDLIKIEILNIKIKHLIVSTSLKKNYFDYPNSDALTIFDLHLSRNEIILLIKEKLKNLIDK